MTKSKTLIFHRVPKTASQCMRSVTVRQYPGSRTYAIEGDKQGAIERFKAFASEEKKKYRLIHGHQAIKLVDHVEAPVVFAMFRDPVDRVIVLLLYYASQPKFIGTKLRELTEKYSIEEFFKQGVDKDWSEFSNGQFSSVAGVLESKTFCGSVAAAATPMERLKSIVREHFAFGLVERFDESLLLLHDRLEWKKPIYYAQINVTRIERTYPEWLRETIRERNKKDVELYEFVKGEFDKRVMARSDLHKATLERFQRTNRSLGAYYTYKYKVLRLVAKVLSSGK